MIFGNPHTNPGAKLWSWGNNEFGMFWGILIPATVGEVLFVAGKLGYTDTAFMGTLIAIFGSPILTLVLSNAKQPTNSNRTAGVR